MSTPEVPSSAAEGPINLRDERWRRGKGLRVTAEAIGVSVKVLRAAERGGTPQPENAVKIARHYGLDPAVQWPDPDRVVPASTIEPQEAAA